MAESSQAETSKTMSRRKQSNKTQFESDFIEYANVINAWENARFGETKPMETFIKQWEMYVHEKPKPGKQAKK